MLCVECLHNQGLRLAATPLAVDRQEPCRACGRLPALSLSYEAIRRLLEDFFVHGSEPPGAGPGTPVLRLSNAREHEPVFDPTLEADYERLASIAGSWLYYYGPPLWKLGITEHDGCVEPPTGDPEALGALLDRCQLLELPVGTKLFRLRLNPSQDPREAATYDTPPRQVLREYQRFDSPELPLFYASPDPETCVHECRTTLADFVALATFETVYPLWLLDLRDDFDEPEGDPHAHFAPLVWRLTGGGPDEYPRCRLLASAMRRFDYLHGFAYRSYYSAIKPRPLTNYALFGFPVKRGLLRLHSLNRIILDRVDYVLRFAPLDT